MKPLSSTQLASVSGGDMPLVMFGAAGGAAYQIGQALGIGELSLTSLAVSTVAGVAVARAIHGIDATHITSHDILAMINAAGTSGYLMSFAMRPHDKETQQLATTVY